MIKQLLCLGSVLITLSATAELPPLVLPEGVGVNVQFTEPDPGEFEMMAAAGCRIVRTGFSWAATERERGRFDFSSYDRLVSALRKNRMHALLVLRCANPLYAPTVAVTNSATGRVNIGAALPVPPDAITGFARWAAAAANHFKGRDIIWEIAFVSSNDTGRTASEIDACAMLVSSASTAMRAADPAVTVIAPGASGFAWEFLNLLCQPGMPGFLQGFSVQPFRHASLPPESAGDDYLKLRALLDRPVPNRARARGRLAIVSSEWGYSSALDSLSPEVQADYVVRQQLFNLLHQVPVSIWYDWRDAGTSSENNAQNFGLVTRSLRPKPAYLALQLMTRELAGYRIERRVDAGDEKIFVLLLNKPGEPAKLAAWTTGEPQTISFAVETEAGRSVKASVCDIRGQTYQPKVKDGQLSLEISGTPQFAVMAGLRLATATRGALPEKPATNSLK